jgi:hypothetical protein
MGVIASALIGVFSVLFGLIANILATITGAFLALAVAVFNWVTSEQFISLSYTNLAGNPFLEIGWTLTRDLTNIFFVIALLIIGLGTTLRITGYQAKKTLPTLIIIALLINFTPVILGLIVDASNIVMNFFLQGGFSGGNTFVNLAFSQWGNIGSLVKGAKFWDPTASNEAIAAAAGSIILVGFNFLAALIYLLFAFIFIFRYVAIWTLVILSPFAFASYILPATRGIWSQWWRHFIQWSIIGIVAAFFLYLGDHFIRHVTPDKLSKISEVTTAPGLAGIFNSILPYFIAIAFLAIGFFMAISTSAGGAGQIINLGKAAGKATGRFVGAQTLGRALATEKGKRWMERCLEKTGLGMRWKEAPAWRKALTAVGAPIAYPLRWGLRAGATAGLAYGAKQEQLIEEEKEKIKKQFGKDFVRAAATYTSIPLTNWRKKIAMGRYLAETGGAKGINQLTKEQKMEVIREVAKYTPAKLGDIIKNTPELIDDRDIGPLIQKVMVSKGKEDPDVKKLIDIGVSEADAVRKAAFKKAVDALKLTDIENLAPDTVKNSEFQEAVVRFKPISFIRRIGEEQGAEYVDMLREKAKELGAREIAKTNLTLLRSAIVNPGFRAVFPPIENAETAEDVEKLGTETREEMKKRREIREEGEVAEKEPLSPSTSRIAKLRRRGEEKKREVRKKIEKLRRRGEKK